MVTVIWGLIISGKPTTGNLENPCFHANQLPKWSVCNRWSRQNWMCGRVFKNPMQLYVVNITTEKYCLGIDDNVRQPRWVAVVSHVVVPWCWNHRLSLLCSSLKTCQFRFVPNEKQRPYNATSRIPYCLNSFTFHVITHSPALHHITQSNEWHSKFNNVQGSQYVLYCNIFCGFMLHDNVSTFTVRQKHAMLQREPSRQFGLSSSFHFTQ